MLRVRGSSISPLDANVKGPELSVTSTSTDWSSSLVTFEFFRIFFRHLFTSALIVQNNHPTTGPFQDLMSTELLCWQGVFVLQAKSSDILEALNILETDLNVFLLPEFNSRGSPRRAANRRKFRTMAYAVKSLTVSRSTALETAQVYTETWVFRISLHHLT